MKREPLFVALASSALGACTFIDPLADLSGGITYAQGTSASPQNSLEVVQVRFPNPQRGGDTNVVVIGWNGTQPSVASVTDSNGNRYVEGIPVVRGSVQSQTIYYATLVAPGESTVSVAFDLSASFADVRVLEYATGGSEASIVAGASATGMSEMAAAGPVATSDTRGLLVAAGTTQGHFQGPGLGFTLRSLTQPDYDIVEDATANPTGAVAAATLMGPAEWVMQVVVLR
jgi:hypothetical protein